MFQNTLFIHSVLEVSLSHASPVLYKQRIMYTQKATPLPVTDPNPGLSLFISENEPMEDGEHSK